MFLQDSGQDLGEFPGRRFIIPCEAGAVVAIGELQDAQYLAFKSDRCRQDLGGAIAAFAIPALVKVQIGVDRLDLLLVVGVRDIEHCSSQSRVARNVFGTDGDPNLAQHGSDLKSCKELIGTVINHIDGVPLAVKEIEHALIEVKKNRVQVLG